MVQSGVFPPKLQASEHWFVDMKFGLQQPAERRHFHLSDAFSQKMLLQRLDKSGAVLMHSLPDFPYKGFRLVSALGFQLVKFSTTFRYTPEV